MALTAQLMASMDDGHLVQALYTELDPLTSTDAERELLARLERLLEHRQVVALVEEYEINHDEIEALGKALGAGVGIADLTATVTLLEEFHATEPNTLRAKLERADKFYDIANDAGDVFTRLSDLVDNTL